LAAVEDLRYRQTNVIALEAASTNAKTLMHGQGLLRVKYIDSRLAI
jgi:hypothetical protein